MNINKDVSAMTLPASGNPISMDQMRTEFGISGAISMNSLYRGGSEVPSSKNLGGTVTTSTASGSGVGDNPNSYDDTNVFALPQTTVSGDTISYSSITATATMGGQHMGFNQCWATWYLTNNGSGSPPPVTSSLGGVSMGYGQGASGTDSQSYSASSSTISTAGLTHIVLRAYGGGGQFSGENTSMSSSMAGGTITLVQNRDANTNVPASGEIEFADLYEATA